MRYFSLLLTAIILVSCSGEKEGASLDIPESFNFLLEQRSSRVIKGSEEAIRVRIGDVTNRKVEVKITGEDEEAEGKLYLDRVMSEGDRSTFDYHGTIYTLEIEELINHLFGDDQAQIAIYKGKPDENFQPVVE